MPTVSWIPKTIPYAIEQGTAKSLWMAISHVCKLLSVQTKAFHDDLSVLCVLSLQLSGKPSQTRIHLLFRILSLMEPIIFYTNGKVSLKHISQLDAQPNIMDLNTQRTYTCVNLK